MNKADVVGKVSELSGVDAETCIKVMDALEKVIEGGVSDKLAGVFRFLKPKDK